MIEFLHSMRKAILAGFSAGMAAYLAAAMKGGVTQNDWYVIVGATLAAGVGVFFTPNRVKPPAGQPPVT